MSDERGEPGLDEPSPSAEPAQPPLPPPSGVDLARSVLAAARARVREGGGLEGSAPGGARVAGRRRPSRSRSGSGPDDRDPQPLAATLRRLVTERGWEPEVATGTVLGRWPEVVGPDLAAHVSPESFTDGVLTVRAESSAWATQTRLLTATIVTRVEQSSGTGSVTRLVVLGPDAPSWRHGPRSVRGRGPRDTYG